MEKNCFEVVIRMGCLREKDSHFLINKTDPLFVPENIKSLINRDITIYRKDVQSKFLMNKFSYISLNFMKCFKLYISNFNYNQIFKEVITNSNNIFTSVIFC